jgi:alcohol oxidase
MDAYAGEVQNMHPFYAYDSPARAKDMDLVTTKAYALPGNLSAGIQHGSWSQPIEAGKTVEVACLSNEKGRLNSNSQPVYEELKYGKEDIKHVEEWVKRHVETTWHSLGVCLPLWCLLPHC